MLLKVCNLTRRFVFKKEGKKQEAAVLRGVNLEVAAGEVVAVLGPSGAGKSTLFQIIAGLQAADEGEIIFAGQKLPLSGTCAGRERMGLIFQDPYSSLSPHLTVAASLMEPIFCRRNRLEGKDRVRIISFVKSFIKSCSNREDLLTLASAALTSVGLIPAGEFLARYPRQLSGGQRQRVAVARALMNDPLLLVADEPVSMLDPPAAVGILNLFRRLAEEKGLAVLLTLHNQAAAFYVSHRVYRLENGVVEPY